MTSGNTSSRRIILLGCGAMAQGATYALGASGKNENLLLVDRDEASCNRLANWVRSLAPSLAVDTLKADVENANDDDALRRAVEGAAAVGMAMPWSATRRALSVLSECGTPIASITRPHYPSVPDLEREVAGVRGRVLLPIGLEPGLTEILGIEAVNRLARVDELAIWCGGIPEQPRPPLNHLVLFGDRLAVAERAAYAVEDNRIVQMNRFDGRESITIDGVGGLEAHHDGMLPWFPLDRDVAGARTVTQKTIRWPGYTESIIFLRRFGLLDDQPIEINGTHVSPQRVVEKVLGPTIARREGDVDITVLRVEARGIDVSDQKSIVRLQCIDRSDATTGLSSMARTTGFTLATALKTIAEPDNLGPAVGILRPHEIFRGDAARKLIGRLCDLGIVISEETFP